MWNEEKRCWDYEIMYVKSSKQFQHGSRSGFWSAHFHSWESSLFPNLHRGRLQGHRIITQISQTRLPRKPIELLSNQRQRKLIKDYFISCLNCNFLCSRKNQSHHLGCMEWNVKWKLKIIEDHQWWNRRSARQQTSKGIRAQKNTKDEAT